MSTAKQNSVARGARRGSRPIRKVPPNGSRLEAYVAHLQTLFHDGAPMYQWDTDYARAYLPCSAACGDIENVASELRSEGIRLLLREEPRLWALPREVIRDALVLPAIAHLDGQAVVETLRNSSTLDQYVDFICEDAWRRASARERLAPSVDNSWCVDLIVLAALHDDVACRSANKRHERAAHRLGIHRGTVRRIEKLWLSAAGRSSDSIDNIVHLCWVTKQLLTEFDERHFT